MKFILCIFSLFFLILYRFNLILLLFLYFCKMFEDEDTNDIESLKKKNFELMDIIEELRY